MDREDLISLSKQGALHNYLKVTDRLPPVVLILGEDQEIYSHMINEKEESKARNKLDSLLFTYQATSYTFISRASATEFISRAKELNDIDALAPEDRMNVLIVVYVENQGEMETHYIPLNESVPDSDSWKKEAIEIMGTFIIKEW